jgi:hypothetical protein
MVWLYTLPNSCIALLFGMIGAALFVGVLFLRLKLWRIQVQSDYAKAARDALTVVIGFAGLILAFSLVQEQNNLRNLEAQVGVEAIARGPRFHLRSPVQRPDLRFTATHH